MLTYQSGVMTLTVPPHGTYVINKQPPNHQIWVSSPASGPARFSVSPDGVWVHHRKQGVQLGPLLEGELKAFLEQAGASGEWEGVPLKK
jgi:frataxin